MRVLLVFCMLLSAGCSQNGLLTKQDYQKSQGDFQHGDADMALLDFPRGREEGRFITTMEKGYLSLLQGKPQMAGLQKQATLQENQVRYHVSREARTFFYVQTPEDYYPSEHEVIWMHFMLSWGYAQQGKYEDACVEARVASSLLTLPWSPAGHFDDPAMRLFLAGLWTMCGEWRDAQVDLRAAWAMDNSLAWAKELAERDRPPAQLFIVLSGPGPDVLWDPELKPNPLRSGRKVSFKLRGRKSAVSITDQHGVPIDPHISPDAGKWYERHLARESELHEIMQDSGYGGEVALSSAKAGAKITGYTAGGVLVGIVAGALGGLFLLDEWNKNTSSSGSSGTTGTTNSTTMSAADAKAAAFVGGVLGGVAGGIAGAAQGVEESSKDMTKELDPSLHYRFVRYLPEYLWMGWSDQAIAYPVELRTATADVEIPRPSVINGASVSVAYLPDSRETSCTYKTDRTSITVVTAPDAAGNCPKEADY